MSPVNLSSEEWKAINKDLPDATHIINRLGNWPLLEYIGLEENLDFDFDSIGKLRISGACFHDSIYNLRAARYALGQAVGTRKYYLDGKDKTKSELENIALGHFYSKFYADYIPLLLWSTSEHALHGVCILFEIRNEQRGQDKLKQTLRHSKQLSQSMLNVLSVFDTSEARKAIWKYRNDWVHNEPPHIETPLYNPPRRDFVMKDLPWEGILIGATIPPDYKWEELLEVLKQGLLDVIRFLEVCFNEWELKYSSLQE